jgi:hypothetical protein
MYQFLNSDVQMWDLVTIAVIIFIAWAGHRLFKSEEDTPRDLSKTVAQLERRIDEIESNQWQLSSRVWKLEYTPVWKRIVARWIGSE